MKKRLVTPFLVILLFIGSIVVPLVSAQNIDIEQQSDTINDKENIINIMFYIGKINNLEIEDIWYNFIAVNLWCNNGHIINENIKIPKLGFRGFIGSNFIFGVVLPILDS